MLITGKWSRVVMTRKLSRYSTSLENCLEYEYVTASYIRPQGLFAQCTLYHFGSKGLYHIPLANLVP